MMTGSKIPVLTHLLSMQIYPLAHIIAAAVALNKLNTHWQMVSILDKKDVHFI
jgi:hypothetical protein